ncbi:hypothetical protein GLP21_19560 [Photobacterium carnosum]|uniref:hypothetical protein n=1 Tax=Photobacterium carnosum TaxID=2023717 RepID=UPI001E31B257|nr:hypothetical protein [Photobacterium carnosum]MCD9550815.1 hypothetical protein [Photobacterium carnosum]MCF2304936.1 hypothetical protein [Photobacterium carnosum]
MADIKNEIIFDYEQKKFITERLNDINFTYQMWGDDSLLDIRCYIRNYYKDLQNGECSFCKRDLSLVSVLNSHVEHIIPKSIYSKFIFEPKNLCVICADCNQIKRDQEVMHSIPNTVKKEYKRYPRTSKSFLIVHPHFDNWHDYIEVYNGAYVGKDDHKDRKGSFTIYACGLNRKLSKFGYEKEVYSDNDLMEAARQLVDGRDLLSKASAISMLKKILCNN